MTKPYTVTWSTVNSIARLGCKSITSLEKDDLREDNGMAEEAAAEARDGHEPYPTRAEKRHGRRKVGSSSHGHGVATAPQLRALLRGWIVETFHRVPICA